MPYTDDPLADFLHRDMEEQRWLERLPKCAECDKPIQQEYAVKIDDNWLCDGCLENMRKPVGDY